MNYNTNIISLFSKLIKQTEENCFQLKETGDKKEAVACQFKIRNYRKGLDIIKSHPKEIKSSNDLKGIPGIGKGIMSRIDEILEKNTLSELINSTNTNTNTNNKLEQINQLQLITGIGPKSAHKLYQSGITLKLLLDELHQIGDPRELTIDDIIEGSNTLDLHIHNMTHHQLIGLKYFHDINERIPRIELTKIETKLKKHIHKIDPKLIMTVCGSYRRERPNSGDIDVLITHPDLKTQTDIDNKGGNYLFDIINKLTKSKLLVDHLTTLGTTKYMGILRLTSKSKGRRIDIRFVARNDYAPALLYFTGSKNFNTAMRSEALKLGYTINEYGIYRLQKKDGVHSFKNYPKM